MTLLPPPHQRLPVQALSARGQERDREATRARKQALRDRVVAAEACRRGDPRRDARGMCFHCRRDHRERERQWERDTGTQLTYLRPPWTRSA